jgi:hypothetical protein
VLLVAADALERAPNEKGADQDAGQASQSSNDDDWSMAMATSSVQAP